MPYAVDHRILNHQKQSFLSKSLLQHILLSQLLNSLFQVQEQLERSRPYTVIHFLELLKPPRSKAVPSLVCSKTVVEASLIPKQ